MSIWKVQILVIFVIFHFLWSVDTQSNDDIWVFNDEKGLLVSFKKVVLTIKNNKGNRYKAEFKTAEAMTIFTIPETDKFISLNLKFPSSKAGVTITTFEMELLFNKSDSGYWSMGGAKLIKLKGRDSENFEFPETRLSSAVDLTAPLTKSFHCTRFGNLYATKRDDRQNQTHTFSIDIMGFQVEAFRRMSLQVKVFKEAYECVGFFTPVIWSGIFVTVILLSILTWGIKMIMDIKTMDRFDNPKGNPISFGCGE